MSLRAWDAAREEDRQFWLVLESELRKVGESYWKELQQISNLQASITQKLPFLDIQPDPETYTRMGFEQLQAHLQVCVDGKISISHKSFTCDSLLVTWRFG